jgi:uncharacterized protein YggE
MNKYIFSIIISAVVFIITLAVISSLKISFPVNVTTSSRSTELSVVGEGKVDVVPDTAYIDVGITVTSVPSVETVQKNINETNNKILESMKGLGIKKDDIKTSNYSIYPEYKDPNDTKSVTYSGNVTISIKVKDTQLASQVVEAATKAGANQVQGTRFVVEDPAKYREQARAKAIANAKEQAQKIAGDLNIKLGRITNIVESSDGSIPVPMYAAKEMAVGGMGGGGPAFEQGSQTITSVVTLYFEKN